MKFRIWMPVVLAMTTCVVFADAESSTETPVEVAGDKGGEYTMVVNKPVGENASRRLVVGKREDRADDRHLRRLGLSKFTWSTLAVECGYDHPSDKAGVVIDEDDHFPSESELQEASGIVERLDFDEAPGNPHLLVSGSATASMVESACKAS